MEVQVSSEEENRIICISGDLDASSAIELDNALEEVLKKPAKGILVDCSGLEYISSPGIGVFISRINDCEKNNTRLVLFGMSDKIRNVFSILGLDQIITISDSKEQAKQSVYGA